MKICYVCNEYPPMPHGGIGTFVHTIATGLAAEGHDITIVGWGNHAQETTVDGVAVVTLPITGLPHLREWSVRWTLHRWLEHQAQSGRFQIVDTPEYSGPVPFRLRSCPIVVRLHLASSAIARHSRMRPRLSTYIRESMTLRHGRCWVPVSEHAFRLTQDTFGFRPARYKVIYYPVCPPIDTSPQLPDLPARYVLYAGTISERKGASQLALAARLFLAETSDVHLVYVGQVARTPTGNADEAIKTILGKRFLARVHFLGRLERSLTLRLMQRAEVFAFPSTLETFGLVIAEAMLMGTPVVVCDLPPCTEFVQHDVTGLLVAPHDSYALAHNILRLLRGGDIARRLGAAGAKHIGEHFSLRKAIENNLSLYREELAHWTRLP